ncbi:MAG: hypothetical protein ACT4RN_12755 [Pseudonocardia sp.]
MNSNDARIARLYTARIGCTVEDPAPNSYSPLPGRFHLILQAKAGGVLGGSGADYTLTFVAIDDDHAVPVPELAPKGSPFAEEWTAADGWRHTGREFVKTSPGDQDGICRYEIVVPDGLTGRFHYDVRLVSANFEVVSFARSNPFILVPATPWPVLPDPY